MATTARGNGNPRARRVLSGADNPLVRAVGRVPATVLAKLLVAFFGTVVLLVILGVLGLRVIADSNDRVVKLGALQQRATAYRQLQTRIADLQQVVNLRVGCVPNGPFPCTPVPPIFSSADSRLVTDAMIRSLLDVQRGSVKPQQVGLFEPPVEDRGALEKITQDYRLLSDAVARVTAIDQAESEASVGLQLVRDIANRLKKLADDLVAKVERVTKGQIDDNARAAADSQRLFVAAAASSVALALLLGYLLSLSIVGPIRRMQTRLAAIASGDFTGHVEVANRDELGALAANLNRMNDELGRLYEALEAASQHKSEFLATMSHELRTPLNAIIGFSQVLKEQMYGELNARQAEYIDDVLSSGQHLLTLINDILDLAKVEAGRMELQPTTFGLPEVFETAMSMVRERAIRQRLRLTMAVDPSVGQLEADERKVKQILVNLLTNAVKFTPADGQITLAASVINDQVEISVRDTGVGISAEDQVKIFEEFYQVGRAKTQEGTGLGLALTRRLVELHHGRMSVESEPGVGSTFTVRLPLRQPGAVGEIAPGTAAQPVAL